MLTEGSRVAAVSLVLLCDDLLIFNYSGGNTRSSTGITQQHWHHAAALASHSSTQHHHIAYAAPHISCCVVLFTCFQHARVLCACAAVIEAGAFALRSILCSARCSVAVAGPHPHSCCCRHPHSCCCRHPHSCCCRPRCSSQATAETQCLQSFSEVSIGHC